jgi:hypothetical protein
MVSSRALSNRSASRKALAAAYPRLEELEARVVLSLPFPDHIVMVIEENHAYQQIIGSSSAPYINSLAQQGALFTQSYAIGHPSQPNYLELFSGSNQGITNDNCLSGHPFNAPNLGGELVSAGLSFGGYSEDMPSVGYTGCTYQKYARKHNPWVDFASVPNSDNMPYAGYFPSDFSTLPLISIVVPNLNNDMHDGTISQGDTWLKNNLKPYIDWTQQHNSLFILTWDEDDNSSGNRIPTIFVGPMVQQGQYSERITHYNVLGTMEAIYGLPFAGQSGNPIMDAWKPVVDHFSVSTGASNPDIAGTPFDVTVTAQDSSGNTVTGYTGMIHFSSGDPYGASLPADYQFTSGDNGSHTFPRGATLYTAGTWDVTATDTSGITGSANVNVQAAPASAFQVIAPSMVSSGMPFDVTVIAVDPYSNTDMNYGGTIIFSTSDTDGRVLLPPPYTFQPSDAGMATFPNGVTLYTLGDQTITVSDMQISGTATVTVTTGPLTDLGISLDRLTSSGLSTVLSDPAAIGGTAGTYAPGLNLATAGTTDWLFALSASDGGWDLSSHTAAAALGIGLQPSTDLNAGVLIADPLANASSL